MAVLKPSVCVCAGEAGSVWTGASLATSFSNVIFGHTGGAGCVGLLPPSSSLQSSFMFLPAILLYTFPVFSHPVMDLIVIYCRSARF